MIKHKAVDLYSLTFQQCVEYQPFCTLFFDSVIIMDSGESVESEPCLGCIAANAAVAQTACVASETPFSFPATGIMIESVSKPLYVST